MLESVNYLTTMVQHRLMNSMQDSNTIKFIPFVFPMVIILLKEFIFLLTCTIQSHPVGKITWIVYASLTTLFATNHSHRLRKSQDCILHIHTNLFFSVKMRPINRAGEIHSSKSIYFLGVFSVVVLTRTAQMNRHLLMWNVRRDYVFYVLFFFFQLIRCLFL